MRIKSSREEELLESSRLIRPAPACAEGDPATDRPDDVVPPVSDPAMEIATDLCAADDLVETDRARLPQPSLLPLDRPGPLQAAGGLAIASGGVGHRPNGRLRPGWSILDGAHAAVFAYERRRPHVCGG